MTPELLLVSVSILGIAFLYSSVGHAGASGYIAVMVLFSFASEQIRPIALTLNILVAAIASWNFYRGGHFRWSLFWPFAVLAVPLAFIGGTIQLPTRHFQFIIGFVLLFSATYLVIRPKETVKIRRPRNLHALAIGSGLGLLAGLTGTGGGIFLTPLLLFLKWAQAKEAAAVSALFILVNSIAGLSGFFAGSGHYPRFAPVLILAAVAGGTAGSFFSSHRFPVVWIKRLLAGVLLVAGAKFIFG